MADYREEREAPEGVTIKEMMEYLKLGRTAVMNRLKRGGYEPIRVENRVHYYADRVVYELSHQKTRKKSTTPKTSAEVLTPCFGKDLRESITHLESEIKILKSQMLKMAKKINEIS